MGGHYAEFEIEGGLLLLLKYSLYVIVELCLCGLNRNRGKIVTNCIMDGSALT